MMRWLAFVACSCIPTFDLNPRKAGSVMYFGMIVVMAIVLVMVTVALAVIVINIYNGDGRSCRVVEWKAWLGQKFFSGCA